MFSEKNLILLRQTCKLKVKARVYTMLSKYNTAKSSLNLKALLSFQNLSQFQSLELIHIFQRTNGRTIHPLPAPVLIMTLSCSPANPVHLLLATQLCHSVQPASIYVIPPHGYIHFTFILSYVLFLIKYLL